LAGLPPVFIEFLGNATGLFATIDEAKVGLAELDAEGGESMEGLGIVGKAAMLGIGAAALGAAYESIKMAAEFQSNMALLGTQAGASKQQIAYLSNGVLSLAGQVGFSPNSLSEALFHVESSFASIGIKGPQALDILKIAAEGAAVGHADLVDVQNALDAAIASGIPGVQNYSQAMGALNAIVGSGDMTMQDLADALGSGVLAVVKGYGLTLNDVGAALATFGDNNIRGKVAATDLRMAVQAMAVPAATAAADLKRFGMSATTLSEDMQKGGLKLALNDLVGRMKKAGVTGTETGQVLTDMFGKKAGSGLAVLVDQIDRLNSKYPELTKGATGFGAAWAATQATFSQRLKQLEAGFQALATRIGLVLLPYAEKFLGWLSSGMALMTRHRSVALALAGAIGGILVVGLAAAGVAAWSFTAAILANPITWLVVGVMALGAGLVMLVMHWKTVVTWVEKTAESSKGFMSLWHAALAFFGAAWAATSKEVQGWAKWLDANVFKWVMARVGDLTSWWRGHTTELSEFWSLCLKQIQVVAGIAWAFLKAGFEILGDVISTAWGIIVAVIKFAWTNISNVVTLGMHLVMNIIGVVLDLITGHWGKACSDFLHLISQAFSDVMHFLGGFLSSIVSLVWSIGSGIVEGIVHGIEDAGGAIASTLEGLAKGALNAAKSFLGINSPSRLFRTEVGQWMAKGIAQGIDDHADSAALSMKQLATGAVGSLRGALGTPLALSASLGGTGLPGALPGGTTAGMPDSATGGTVTVTNHVTVTVEGSVRSDQELRDIFQEEMLKLGARNNGTWRPYRR